MRERWIETQFCVVGGGLAGICASLAASRHGARVMLVHNRPVLGGNSSSEIRIHVRGASGWPIRKGRRETGIVEELLLENLRRNPQRSFSIWDTVLYDKVKAEKNMTLLLNTSALKAKMDGENIKEITAYQSTTETLFRISAELFADCSGDGVLAPLTGAKFRIGRESRSEFNESLAPEVADDKTLGMTCLFAARDAGRPMSFEPPRWAYDFPTEDSFGPGRRGHNWLEMGYWWIELGGDRDVIHDAEDIRDELLKIVFGVWDHIKNHGDHGAENWVLDWVQFLPGKREGRRFIGDYVLTQPDVESGGNFSDTVAYGGWPMDDHPPGGFFSTEPPCRQIHLDHPYGIPYRCLYSRNIGNLFFAGRNISATHVAFSSTRVMGTAGVMGQAVGTAAALAIKYGLSPREVGQQKIQELQQALLADDCYLPCVKAVVPELTREAKITSSKGDPNPVHDGVTRQIGEDVHSWEGSAGDWVQYEWSNERRIGEVRLTFDSNLDADIALSYHGSYGKEALNSPPVELVKDFRLEALQDGVWQVVSRVTGNCQRFVRIPLNLKANAVRLICECTYGSPGVRVFRFEVL